MQLKIIIFISLLLLPILSTANELESESNLTKLESMDIKSLIEKAKIVSSQEREEIEKLIKKKISKAHRENYISG